MTEAEKRRAEAIWKYTISQQKVLKRLVDKGIFTQEHADYMSDQRSDIATISNSE